ncbi:MAG: DUF4956 domain-containing protein [Acidobacteriota bacterium]
MDLELLRSLDHPSWQRQDSLEALALALLLVFVLSQAVAWLYARTHGALSYSSGFTQSLVLMSMVVTLVMFVIGDSIVAAFGLLGALAIVRFRNVLKDTRDTVYVFFVLVMGMAVGSGRFLTAIIGTTAFIAVVSYLRFTDFGTLGRFDAHVSLRLPEAGQGAADRLLYRYCAVAKPVSVRHGGAGEPAELLFQVRLRDRGRGRELLSELERLDGACDLALVMRDEMAEL